MNRTAQASVALAAAAIAAAAGFYAAGGGPRAQPTEVAATTPPAVLEHCRRAAQLLYDVSWASACTTHGVDNTASECTLPDAQAARVNAILEAEELRCIAQERAAMAP